MNATQEQIEHLRTIQETSDFWADVAENQLPALADKIDNIDFSTVAKQGDNQEATNSAILEGIERILARSVKYDTSTGNLQFDNIDLTIV